MVRFADLNRKFGDDAPKTSQGATDEGTDAMSPDDHPTSSEADEPTGTPQGEVDEGLTAEEREMLSSLSGGGATPSAPEAPAEKDDGLSGAFTPEEQAMLASISGRKPTPTGPEGDAEPAPTGSESDAEPTPGPPPVDVEDAPVAQATDEAAALSDAEQQVREQLREESERLSREAVPAMFDETKTSEEKPAEVVPEVGPSEETEAPETPEPEPEPEEAPADETDEAVAPEVVPATEEGRLAKIVAWPLDLINRPFRWLPPVWRMGLGLCGILLLITLLLVIVVRVLFGE